MMFFEVIARIFGADPHKTSYDHTTPLSSTRRRSNSRSRGSQEVDEEATKNNSALNARVEENNVNFILLPLFGNVHYLMIPSVILGGILVCIWLMFQSEEWAWVLQDVMGVAFLVNVMRLVHLPNLKIATLLLTCAMSYDIFWVYIQPHLFGKESVMVNVARGGDQHESLPMLFMFPRIGGSQGEYSMLGYGDVILPGLLIVHNALFENRFYSSSSSSSPTGGKVVVFTNRRKGGYKNEVQILRLLYIRVLRRYDFNLHRVILESWRSRRSTGVDVFSPDDGADDGVCRVDERRVKRDVEWW